MKTITFDKLRHLSFCNSPKMPQKVIHDGIVKQWVGIGWVDEGKPTAAQVKLLPKVVK
jgi:hypothetical protein